MKVIVVAALLLLANGASLTYTTGPVRSLPHSEVRTPERSSRVQESVHHESGDALGNRAGSFISKDNEGNLRAVRYTSGLEQAPAGHQQQRETVYGVPASAPARYSYDSVDRPLIYRYGSVPRSHSITFTAPLANTYSLYPQFPHYGSTGRYI